MNMLVLLCKNSSSLKQYFSQLRSVLRLARCELGALSSTSHLVKGAWKRAPAAARFRARATPEQARGLPPLVWECTGLALRRWVVQAQKLIAWARDVAGRADVADSWAIAWQFCLRYGSEAVLLNARGHSVVTVANEAGRLDSPTSRLVLGTPACRSRPRWRASRLCCARLIGSRNSYGEGLESVRPAGAGPSPRAASPGAYATCRAGGYAACARCIGACRARGYCSSQRLHTGTGSPC